MPQYRVTNVDVMRDQYGRRVRGVAVAGGPEVKLGREPHGLTFKRNDLVYIEQPGDLVPVFYAPGGPSGDRLWTNTHVTLLEQQIREIGDRIDNVGTAKCGRDCQAFRDDTGSVLHSTDCAASLQSDDARDLYHRIRQTLINMRRPVEG